MSNNNIKTAFACFTSPANTWKQIGSKKVTDNQELLNNLMYPVMGWVTILCFIGVLLNRQELDFAIALKKSIKLFIQLFVGFFISSVFLNKMLVRFFKKRDDLVRVQHFVGYSSMVVYVIYILTFLLPSMTILKFGYLYILYIIWTGGASYLKIKENSLFKFTILATLSIIGSLWLVEFVMNRLIS